MARIVIVCFVLVLGGLAFVCPPETETTSFSVSVERWDAGQPQGVAYEVTTVEAIGYGRYKVFGEPLHYARPAGDLERETANELHYKDGRRLRFRTDYTRLTATCALIVALGALICTLMTPQRSHAPEREKGIS